MRFVDILRIGGKLLAGKFLRRNFPLSVELGITYRCCLACKYCLIIDPANYLNNNQNLAKSDMSLPQIKNVLTLLGHMGVERINLSGGEPLIRNDIDKILESSYLLKGKVSLTTNGILVPKYCDLLKGLDFLSISINGAKKTHNYLAGATTHESVLNAIQLAKSKSIQVFLSAVITAHTTEEDVDFLLRLANDYDTFCICQPLFEGGYFEDDYVKFANIQSIAPSLSHLESICNYMKYSPYRHRIVGGQDFIEFILKYNRDKAEGLTSIKKCIAGNGFFYISPSGDFFPCSLMFKKILHKKFYECNPNEINSIKINEINCAGCLCYSNIMLDRFGRFDIHAMVDVLIKQYIK